MSQRILNVLMHCVMIHMKALDNVIDGLPYD